MSYKVELCINIALNIFVSLLLLFSASFKMNLENRHLDCWKNNSRESWKVESLPFNSLVGAFYRGLQREQAFEGVMV